MRDQMGESEHIFISFLAITIQVNILFTVESTRGFEYIADFVTHEGYDLLTLLQLLFSFA